MFGPARSGVDFSNRFEDRAPRPARLVAQSLFLALFLGVLTSASGQQSEQPAQAQGAVPSPLVTVTVTKIATMTHRIDFENNSDVLKVPNGPYLKFIEALKAHDVVGINFLYYEGMDVDTSGGDLNARERIRRKRLVEAHKPITSFAQERSIPIKLINFGYGALTPERIEKAIVVEVIHRR